MVQTQTLSCPDTEPEQIQSVCFSSVLEITLVASLEISLTCTLISFFLEVVKNMELVSVNVT